MDWYTIAHYITTDKIQCVLRRKVNQLSTLCKKQSITFLQKYFWLKYSNILSIFTSMRNVLQQLLELLKTAVSCSKAASWFLPWRRDSLLYPWGRFNTVIMSYQYRYSHCCDKMILWLFISTMWFPMLLRHLYIELGPCFSYPPLIRLIFKHTYNSA